MSPEYHLSMFFWVDHFDTNCGTVSENKEPRRIQCIIDFPQEFSQNWNLYLSQIHLITLMSSDLPSCRVRRGGG